MSDCVHKTKEYVETQAYFTEYIQADSQPWNIKIKLMIFQTFQTSL